MPHTKGYVIKTIWKKKINQPKQVDVAVAAVGVTFHKKGHTTACTMDDDAMLQHLH